MRGTHAAAVAVLVALACTTVEVRPVPASGYPLAELCIERNPYVVVDDFLPVLERGFARHGIATRTLDTPLPPECEYSLYYEARRRWDIQPVLGYAELRVRFRGETVGSATYVAHPSLSLLKWRSTESKLGPVIDELLAQFPRR